MEQFLDSSICEDFRSAINATPIFSHDENYRGNFSLYCAIMDRMDDSVKYLNAHSDLPKTETDFLVFIMYTCMVLDAIKELQRTLHFHNKYNDKTSDDAYIYFKNLCKESLKLEDDNCPTDEQFFQYFRSLAMAHPFETSRVKFLRKNKETQYSPWPIINDTLSREPLVGIRIYSNKVDDIKDLRFPFSLLKDYINSRFQLMRLATESIETIVNNQLEIWKSNKISYNSDPIETLKEISETLKIRFQKTYDIKDLTTTLTTKSTNPVNNDLIHKFKNNLISKIPNIVESVNNLDYNTMTSIIWDNLDVRPSDMHEMFHYQREKIFGSLSRYGTGDPWGIDQLHAFIRDFSHKWVVIDSEKMSNDEIILLVRTACFTEWDSQIHSNK